MRDIEKDPYAIFHFVVEITGVQVAGFSEVTGLQAETETEDYREGGVNNYLHKLAKFTKYPNLVLKRGLTGLDQLWQWHQEVVEGKFKRQEIAIVLRDSQQNETWRWEFSDAYPVKWSGSDLNAMSSAVFVESVEFAHNGMK